MAPPVPDKIECTTSAAFASELRNIQATLNQPESEDNWEQLGRALQTLASLARGGAHKLDPDYVDAIKSSYKPITTSMLSERTRLSSTATDLISAIAPRLGQRFDALVPLLFPSIIKLCNRPNKVFLARAQKCLTLIIEHCHAVTIIPFLRESAKEKAVAIRLSAIQGTLLVLQHFDPRILEIREGSIRTNRNKGNIEDVEAIIKDTARDANPEVRKISREVFEKYSELYPDRVPNFTGPLTPTIRRYLAISANSKGGSSHARPAPKPAAKLAIPEPAVAGPSKPSKVQDEQPVSKPPTRPVPQRAFRMPPPAAPSADADTRRTATVPAAFTRVGRVASATYSQKDEGRPTRPAVQETEEVPSRPASRLNHVPSSSASSVAVDERNQQSGPTRPLNIVKSSRPALTTSSAPSSSSLSSAPIRAGNSARAAVESSSRGPVRPQMTARAVTVQDPPFRPMTMRQDRPPPKKRPSPVIQIKEVEKAVIEVNPEPEEIVISSPITQVAELVVEPVKSPISVEESPAPAPAPSSSSPKPSTPIEEMVRPASVSSTVSVATTSTPSASLPAVLAKRLEARTKAAAQPGGFVPKRRRAGLTEPTLSQLAKQKPSKPFVPQEKKMEPSKVTKQPVVANVKKVAPVKVAQKPELIDRKASPTPSIPPEVAVAALIPLPIVTPDEVPLPPVEADEIPLPPPTVDDELELDMDYLSALTKTPAPRAPITPKLPRQSTCLIDFNTSIVVADGVEETPRAPSGPGANLLDFDISVVMSDEQSTLVPVAPAPTTFQPQSHPFLVLQDLDDDQFKTPVAPVRFFRPQSRVGKDEEVRMAKDVEEKRRTALGEKLLNVAVPLRS